MIEADCTIGEDAVFSLRNLDPMYHIAAQDLAFTASGNTFTRTFSATMPQLDQICANFQRAATALVLQTARLQPVPWQTAFQH